MVQVFRLENPLFCRCLSWPQRLCYFNATTHFLFAAPRLIFLTMPLAYQRERVSPVLATNKRRRRDVDEFTARVGAMTSSCAGGHRSMRSTTQATRASTITGGGGIPCVRK